MTLFSRFVMLVALAGLPLLARGEGKCDDDPVEFGPAGQLVVTWSIPHPQGALVRFTGEEVFNEVDRQLGLSSFHPDYPAKYKNPKSVNFFNDTELTSADALKSWQARFKIAMPAESVAAFDEYVRGGHHLRGALVEHPRVSPVGYSICSCVLQRGVAVYYPGSKQEDLYVRSHFASANPAQKTFEIFAPRGGYWFSFKRDKIWFPLRLNKLLKEQAWMVLDILTPKGKPLPAGAVPAPYKVAKQGQVKLFNQDFEATRVLGTFEPGKAVADLELSPP